MTNLKQLLSFFIIFILFLISFSVAEDLNSAQVVVEETNRTFYWYQPESLETHFEKRPLVLAFHGYKSTPEGFAKLTGLNALAEKEQFYVAYPVGQNKAWNAGANLNDHDQSDVLFVDKVLNDLNSKVPVDLNRIYALGMSNGGFFAIRLACQRPQAIAAVGSVAATMAQPYLLEGCEFKQRAVPVGLINGTEDPVVLWQGGIGKLADDFPDSRIASVDKTVAFWA